MSIRSWKSPRWGMRRLWALAFSAIAMCVVLGAALVFVPVISPAAGAETADFLRSIFGPEPVARLESLSFRMKDDFYRLFPPANGSGPAVSWASGVAATPELLVVPPGEADLTETPAASGPALPDLTPTLQASAAPIFDVVSASPQIGWQAYGPSPNGTPLLARALIMVDPSRSYAGVALVRMDLSLLQLHIMAGNLEPAHPSGIGELIPNLGAIAPDDQSRLIAAFNGGFKAVHGHYGMMVDRVSLLPPEDGMATVALYQDGSVRLGTWGNDIVTSPDMVSYRQNCPPLVEQGELNPGLLAYPDKAWGATNTQDATWRTALGLTRDGRYLIYAVGNGTSVAFLAEALLEAGAYNGMQLDINQYYSHFMTYSVVSDASTGASQLQGQQLLQQMIDTRRLYLTPYPRDFFYMTLRP